MSELPRIAVGKKKSEKKTVDRTDKKYKQSYRKTTMENIMNANPPSIKQMTVLKKRTHKVKSILGSPISPASNQLPVILEDTPVNISISKTRRKRVSILPKISEESKLVETYKKLIVEECDKDPVLEGKRRRLTSKRQRPSDLYDQKFVDVFTKVECKYRRAIAKDYKKHMDTLHEIKHNGQKYLTYEANLCCNDEERGHLLDIATKLHIVYPKSSLKDVSIATLHAYYVINLIEHTEYELKESLYKDYADNPRQVHQMYLGLTTRDIKMGDVNLSDKFRKRMLFNH